MSVSFDKINLAFDKIAYPFNNILLTLIRGTATSRGSLPVKPAFIIVLKPVITLTTRVSEPAPPPSRVS